MKDYFAQFFVKTPDSNGYEACVTVHFKANFGHAGETCQSMVGKIQGRLPGEYKDREITLGSIYRSKKRVPASILKPLGTIDLS